MATTEMLAQAIKAEPVELIAKWRVLELVAKWEAEKASEQQAERLSDADVLSIASNPLTCPCSPWWLRGDVTCGDVRNAALVFANAIESACAAKWGVKLSSQEGAGT